MKKIYILLIMLFTAGLLFGDDLIINKTDGSQIAVPIDQIEEITFQQSGSGDIETLLSWMTGAFSSEAQADTSDDQYHVWVLLYMTRIWDHLPTEDGYWIYVEQGYAEPQYTPYRQRIYKVFEGDSGLQDEIFTFPNTSQYVGAWETPAVFDAISMDDLTLKSGCDVHFEWLGDHFYGSTQGITCTTSIPGVAYITSETTIFPDHLTSWDLGYNSSGTIVMGPYSPYIFDKIQDLPLGE